MQSLQFQPDSYENLETVSQLCFMRGDSSFLIYFFFFQAQDF
jgi:hypothetical protein